MKYNQNIDYYHKFSDESFDISYDFTNDLNGDILSSSVVTCTDSDGTDTSSLISDTSTSSPNTDLHLVMELLVKHTK